MNRASLEKVTEKILSAIGVEYGKSETKSDKAEIHQQAEDLIKSLGADGIAKMAVLMQQLNQKRKAS